MRKILIVVSALSLARAQGNDFVNASEPETTNPPPPEPVGDALPSGPIIPPILPEGEEDDHTVVFDILGDLDNAEELDDTEVESCLVDTDCENHPY